MTITINLLIVYLLSSMYMKNKGDEYFSEPKDVFVTNVLAFFPILNTIVTIELLYLDFKCFILEQKIKRDKYE